MTSTPRRASVIVLVVVAVIAVVGGLGYGFRDRLVELPGVDGLFAPGDAGTADTMDMSASASDGMAMPPPAAESGQVDPRAPVSLDLRRQQLIGVRIATVQEEAVARTVRAVGMVRYDETRLAEVNLQLEGWIRELYVDYTGRLVRQGEPLFTLYSPDLLTTQQEYLLALRTRDQLRESQIPDVRERAERLVEAARQRIALWGLPPDLIEMLDETREAQPEVTFRSPVAGYVIEKHAVQGAHVTPGQTLYRIADLSRVWVEADVYEQEMSLVRVGMPTAVTLDAYPDERFTGRVVYVYPFVEPSTRTMRVRLELPNRADRLKPGMYANVALEASLGMSVTMPSDALLDSGTRQLAFVAEGDGYFQPREIRVGQRLGDRVQILDGLSPGERVAVGATFFLDSESQLRSAVQSFEPPPASAAGGAAAEQLDITFRPQPDPPRTGDNQFEVTVTDASGQPVPDADVSVTFFMAAMPTMNMPAMRSETTLEPAGGGVYRGSGQVLMGGRWDVTVTVSRDGERVGARQFGVVAR